MCYHFSPPRYDVTMDAARLFRGLDEDELIKAQRLGVKIGWLQEACLSNPGRLRDSSEQSLRAQRFFLVSATSSSSRPLFPSSCFAHLSLMRCVAHRSQALVLDELLDEKPLFVIQEQYGVERGEVQKLTGTTAMFAGQLSTFCNRLGWESLSILALHYQERFSHVVKVCDDHCACLFVSPQSSWC
jgi:hypothetical protein